MDILANFSVKAVLFMIGMVSAILLLLAYLSWRNPVLMKIGLRNILRRPAQSILIIIGMTLSTVIIVSAFGTGDTLSYSVKRQAVAAYGEVDEIIAPPLLSMLATIDSTEGEEAVFDELGDTMDELTAGGLESVLAFVRGGLPSLSEERLDELREEAAAEPLIDGVSGAIVFPTILRNTTTGAGEPLGMIYAVDDTYPTTFGLHNMNGEALEMTSLQPGIGNVFLAASDLFQLASGQLGQLMGDDGSMTAQAIAGLGALFTGVATNQLPELKLDIATLQELGVDTSILEEMGIEQLDIETVATAIGLSEEQASGMASTVDDQLGAVGELSGQLLEIVNLNTLGYEIDRVLGRYGLQMRQGDVYLSSLAAERLGARPGDIVEVFVGPMPVRFRVRDVVEQAGPMGALVPVVMMPLDEAQQLLFMNDKVNTVLVSNIGDELGGLQHTGEVTKRLSELAMDPIALTAIGKILQRPDVAAVIRKEAPDLLANPNMDMDEDMPVFLQNLFAGLGESFGMQAATPEQVDTLLRFVDGDDSADLRHVLVNTSLRTWLVANIELPGDATEVLTEQLSVLNTFDVITPLNKATIVTAATVGGTVFSSIFSLFGALSILAAVLLIFLIFIMLAAERRSEIGIARAVGTQRRQVVQMFITEGMVYAMAASALGVVVGIAVTYGMTAFMGQLFNDLTGQLNSQAAGLVRISFNISWQSVIISYCLGIIMTFLVIVIASYRASRMNIVSAVRGLPDRGGGRSRKGLRGVWQWMLPSLVAIGGIALIVYATPGGFFSLALLGLTFLLSGFVMLVGRLLDRTQMRHESVERFVYTTIGLALLVLWISPWMRLAEDAFPELWGYSPVQLPILFLSSAIFIVVGAIMVIMVNADAIGWVFSRILGFIPWLRPVLRTAIAYPLNTRFRTGMIMVLFAMIMASVVVMAVVIHATQSLIELDDQSTGGFQIEVSPTLLSFFSPVKDFETLLDEQADPDTRAEIEQVGVIYRDVLSARADNGEWMYSGVNGLNAGYTLQAQDIYPLQARAAGYESDAAVWQAIRDGEDVAIIKPRKLGEGRQSEFDFSEDEEEFTAGRHGADSRDMWLNEFFLPDVEIVDGLLPEVTIEVKAIVDEEQGEVAESRTLQIIGVLEEDDSLAWSSVQTSDTVLRDILGAEPSEVKYFVRVQDGTDVREAARRIEAFFVPNGLDAVVVEDRFLQGQQLLSGVLRLLQGFMALGLLVGIAALGVVSTRAVVERRQQVGMLRAIGYQRSMVGLSFLLESSFISLSGLLIGSLTGIVLGGMVLQLSWPDMSLMSREAIPWLAIMYTIIAAYLFSLLTTIVPVWQASRIYPAEALRYE